MEKFKAIYEKVAAIPSILHAEFIKNSFSDNNEFTVQVTWCCRNLESMHLENVVENFVVTHNKVIALPSSKSLPNTVLQTRSPMGDQEALILQDACRQKLIIIGNSKKQQTFDLSNKKLHGKIYCDPYISSLNWSSNGDSIVYVAEEYQPNRTDYFQDKNGDAGNGEFKSKYEYIEDWGEQMDGQHQSVVVSVCTKKGTQNVYALEDGLTSGEVQFVPNSNEIIGLANTSKPFRLGRAYSSDRESFIFHLKDGLYAELTPRGQHVERIRFSPDGSKLICLVSSTFGSVAYTSQICLMDWATKAMTLLLDYVPTYMTLLDGQLFRGVCPKTILPMRCWNASSTKIYFSALDLNNYCLYEMDIATKNIRRYKNIKSVVLLDIVNDNVLLKLSTVTEPDCLYWVTLSESDFFDFELHSVVVTDLDEVKSDWYDIWQFEVPSSDRRSHMMISAMYIGPTNTEGEKRPLVIWPHGGPHSITTNNFNYIFATLVLCGYSIVLPNYRGSSGMGQDVYTSSVGYCGLYDIDDCKTTVEQCLNRFNVLDEKRVYGVGLSHGGSLVAHLNSKFPNLFQAVCLMNTVFELVSMTTISDVPEWCYLEFGCSYEMGRSMDEKSLKTLHERSPSTYVDQVKCPTLQILGNQDRRCPISQGLHYHRMLLTKDIPSRVLIYEDSHGLQKLSSESDSLMEMLLWFEKNK